MVWSEFFSSPICAFPVVLQIDSHTTHERRGQNTCGKLFRVRIICFVDSFETVAAFSDAHIFLHLGLWKSHFYSLWTRMTSPETIL